MRKNAKKLWLIHVQKVKTKKLEYKSLLTQQIQCILNQLIWKIAC